MPMQPSLLASLAPYSDIPTIFAGPLSGATAQPNATSAAVSNALAGAGSFTPVKPAASASPPPVPADTDPNDVAWNTMTDAQKAAKAAEDAAAGYNVNLQPMPQFPDVPIDRNIKLDRWTQLGMILAGLLSRGATVPMATAEGTYQQNQQADYQRRLAQAQAKYQAQASSVEEANKTQLALASEKERIAADRERAAEVSERAYEQAVRMQQAEADRQTKHDEWLKTFFQRNQEFSTRMSFAQTSLQQRLDAAMARTQLSVAQRNQALGVRLGLAEASNKVRLALAGKQTQANAAVNLKLKGYQTQLHYYQGEMDKWAAVLNNPLVDPTSQQFKDAQSKFLDAQQKSQGILDNLTTLGIDTSDAASGYADLATQYDQDVSSIMSGLNAGGGITIQNIEPGGGGTGTDTGQPPAPTATPTTYSITDYVNYAKTLTPQQRQTWLSTIKSSNASLYAQVTQALKGQ
jgi:hypothetical protein